MMITIHGFPAKTKYQDVKLLIKGECNINDFILDNLLIENSGTKKVRIGLTDNSDGYKLMKCLDGYRMPGNCVLKVVPVGRTGSNPPESNFDSRSTYPNHHRNEYPNLSRNDYVSHSPNDYMNKGVHGNVGPHGPVGSHMPGGSGYGSYDSSGSYGHGSQGPRGLHGQPSLQNIDMSRPSPWASSSTSSSQWTPNQPMASQIPQNSFNFNAQQLNVNPAFGQQLPRNPGHPQPFTQGRAGPDQNPGFPSKNIPSAVPTNSRYRWHKSYDPDPNPEPPPASVRPQPGPKKQKKIDNIKSLRKSFAEAKLNGRARARVYWWMKQGKTLKEALELCQTTKLEDVPEYAEAKLAKKKEAAKKRKEKRPKTKPNDANTLARWKPPIPPTELTNILKVSVMDSAGPISYENGDKLKQLIMGRIVPDENGDSPKFYCSRQLHGALLLDCANISTKEWLLAQMPTLQPWEGANLVVVDRHRRVIALCFVHDTSLDDEELINLLKRQNDKMDFSEWRVVSRKPEQTGQMVTFSMDGTSLKPLEDRKFKLFLGLGKVNVRVVSKTEKNASNGGPGGSGVKPNKQPKKPIMKAKRPRPENKLSRREKQLARTIARIPDFFS